MNKIEKLINELCPKGVEWKEVGEVSQLKKGKQLNKSLLTKEGKYPAYNGGQSESGRTEQYNVNENTTIISQGGASAGFVNFITTKFWANAHCYYLIPNKKIIDNRYLYHFIKMNQKMLMESHYGPGIPALKVNSISTIKIPIPPLEIQEEIVKILDKFTDYVTELTTELTLRQKQYNYYRDKLLLLDKKEVELVKLSKICKIYDGTHQTPKYTNEGVPFVSVENIKNLYSTLKHISNDDYKKFKIKPKINDIFMTRIGDVGTCTVVDRDEDLAYYVSLALIRPDTDYINPYYLKYYIESTLGRRELNKRILHTAVPIKINMGDIGKIMIPLPSLEIQNRVVKVLDNFETIINDISNGLPKEIELRQKQYEYYRDKLLSFE